MHNILREIFDGTYDITPERDKKQQELDEKIHEEWDKVTKLLGDKFVDRVFELQGEREDWQNFHYYREGYRAGVRLMLEAFGL